MNHAPSTLEEVVLVGGPMGGRTVSVHAQTLRLEVPKRDWRRVSYYAARITPRGRLGRYIYERAGMNHGSLPVFVWVPVKTVPTP